MLPRHASPALPSSFLLLLLLLHAIFADVTAWPLPGWQEAKTNKGANQHLQSRIGHWSPIAKRDPSDVFDVSTGLPAHHWQLAKTAAEIEQFRQQHNLILVESHEQDAALMPSWPQAFVQYLFISTPPTCFSISTVLVNGQPVDQTSSISFWVLVLTSPPLFVAWTVAWGLTQAAKTNAGWISVLGWSSWLSLSFEGWWGVSIWPLLFQLSASFAIIIQRWCGNVGAVAYQIVDSHGCTPSEGLSFLEQGARSRQYRILQTVMFSLAVLCGVSHLWDWDRRTFAAQLAFIAFAELIMDVIVASSGTPMVVSGDCLLVELNPRLGFLDSGISRGWKALSSFMGF